jgi:serine/threonine-protein kinase
MTTSDIKTIVDRARAWYLARTLGVYAIAGSAALQGIDLLESQFGLPAWFFPTGLALLLIGLPVVAATAVMQNRRDPAGPGAEPAAANAAARGDERAGALSRLFTWRRAALAGVLAFLALGTLGAAAVWSRNRDRDVQADVVAVMPFHVVGADADLWREGLVDLVGTALDATGQFQASDPRAVLNRWRRAATEPGELPEPAKAAEVAASLGAGRVIIGSLLRIPPDRVRLAADMYSVRWLRKQASAAVEGLETEMMALVDRLTVDLLRSVWRGDSIPEIRVSATTTASIPALRAYLEGEQAFRRSQFTEAQAAFGRAVEYDSTFALAYYRLAQAYGWYLGLASSEVPDYLAAAERHSDGLSRRDSLLIRAWKLADVDGDLSAIPIFQRLTERYPDDLEAWYGLGDAILHMGAQLGRPVTSAVEPLERTLALDPTFAPALIHLIEIAYLLGDAERGREWSDRYLALDSTSLYARSFRLLTPLRFGPPADSARAAAVLDTADAELLGWLNSRLRGPGRDTPLFEKIARAATDPKFDDRFRAEAYWGLAELELRRGRIAAALALLERVASMPETKMQDAVLSLVASVRELGLADDPASERLVERLADGLDYTPPALAVAAARAGDDERTAAAVASIKTYADRLTAEGRMEQGWSVEGQVWALRGRIAAAHDSADAAIAYLRRGLGMINATWSRPRDFNRYWLATLVEDRGRSKEALAIYGSLYWTPWLEPIALLRRAELHERRGERAEALAYYARFIELWKDADPHLQPQVESARLAVDRLRGERAAG